MHVIKMYFFEGMNIEKSIIVLLKIFFKREKKDIRCHKHYFTLLLFYFESGIIRTAVRPSAFDSIGLAVFISILFILFSLDIGAALQVFPSLTAVQCRFEKL